jgi:Lrp/AsnC family transcriptional regulator, leucine-responsive regulatory protein
MGCRPTGDANQRIGPASIVFENTCVVAQYFCVATPLVLDEFDHRLLDLLQRDAATTLTALGEAVGLSASAVQRRIKRYRESGLMRTVAVLNPSQLGNVTLATVLVALERESARHHAALHARLRAAPEVQQCYVLAGEWDYLLILATSGLAHTREVAERLFGNDANLKRYETRMVFEPIKLGLAVPTRAPIAKRKR